MLDIAALKALVPTLSTTNSSSLTTPQRPPAKKKHPRDNVIALIENNLTLLANPSHVFYNKRKNKPSKVERCLQVNADGTAHVWVTYSKKKLVLNQSTGDDVLTGVPVSVLPQVLDNIKAQVAAGKLDAQIEPIHKERSDTMKNKKKSNSGQSPKKAA